MRLIYPRIEYTNHADVVIDLDHKDESTTT